MKTNQRANKRAWIMQLGRRGQDLAIVDYLTPERWDIETGAKVAKLVLMGYNFGEGKSTTNPSSYPLRWPLDTVSSRNRSLDFGSSFQPLGCIEGQKYWVHFHTLCEVS